MEGPGTQGPSPQLFNMNPISQRPLAPQSLTRRPHLLFFPETDAGGLCFHYLLPFSLLSDLPPMVQAEMFGFTPLHE